jgi:hypothetical protein
VAIAVAVLAPRLAGIVSMNIFDDAFITFRHATNLAAGHGMAFNAGDEVLGTTSPLFAVLLALWAWLGVPPTATSIALGLVCDVLTGLLTFAVLRRATGIYAALGFLGFFAVDPHVIRVAVGGMESSLFLFVSILIAWLLAREEEGRALVASAIAFWIRPEGAAWGLLSLVALWRRSNSPLRWRYTAAAALAVLLPALLIWFHYGDVLPQSVASKGRRVGGSLGEVLGIFFFPEGSPFQSALTLLALFGLPRAWRASATLRWYLMFSGLYMVAYIIARPQMWTWYALPIYFGKAVLAGVAVGWALEHLLARRVPVRFATWSVLGVSGLAAAGLLVYAGPSPVRKNVYEPLAAWARDHVRPGQTIAAGDIGAVGYYSTAFVYDLAGLVWKDRWRYDTVRDAVIQRQPDFIFAEVSRYWQELYEPRSDLRKLYRPVKRFSRFGKTTLEPRADDLAPGWIQDYIMFERRRDKDGQ